MMLKTLKYKKIYIIFIIFLLCGILLAGCNLYFSFNKKNKKPYIFLIAIDALRRDHLGIYGYERNISPNIDRLAEQSSIFLKAYSQSTWTKPSFGSMMTGQYSLTHKLLSNKVTDFNIIPDNIKTIPEILKENGYDTIGLTDGGFVHGRYGFNRGFDIYKDDKRRGIAESLSILENEMSSRVNPLFVFLHTYDVHGPYGGRDVPVYNNQEKYHGKFFGSVGKDEEFYKLYNKIWAGELQVSEDDIHFIINNYDHCIKYVDSQLGKFFNFLKKKKIWDTSLIIIISDHGERFRLIKNRDFSLHPAKYFIEHIGFSDLLTKVPLIVKMPGQKRKQIINRNVSAGIDILPTILQVLKIKPDHLKLPGFSLFDKHNDRPVFFTKLNAGLGLIKNDKYILFKRTNLNLLPIIDAGPYSFKANNYAIEDGGIDIKNAEKIIQERIKQINEINSFYLAEHKLKEQEIEQQLKEQLKSLGYIQ